MMLIIFRTVWGATTLIFFSVFFIEYLMVDMNQKRRTQFSGWRTAVSSPESPWGTESSTHLCSGGLPDEYFNPVPPSDSPGPDGLCALSLDTPEKKAKVVSGLDHKHKLKKLSRKVGQCSASSSVILGYPDWFYPELPVKMSAMFFRAFSQHHKVPQAGQRFRILSL